MMTIFCKNCLTGYCYVLKRLVKSNLLPNQQAHCGVQQKGGSVQNILQVELLSAQLKEAHSKAALIESRHRLLQLQTEVHSFYVVPNIIALNNDKFNIFNRLK